MLLILWDGAKHVVLYERLTGNAWPSALDFVRNSRALQNEIAWPESWTRVPLGEKILRTDLLGLPAIDLDVNLPAVLVEQMIPVGLMIGLPILLAIALWRTGIAKSRRDHMIAQFSGFISVFVILTIVGTAFRGRGMELFWFWEVKPPIS